MSRGLAGAEHHAQIRTTLHGAMRLSGLTRTTWRLMNSGKELKSYLTRSECSHGSDVCRGVVVALSSKLDIGLFESGRELSCAHHRSDKDRRTPIHLSRTNCRRKVILSRPSLMCLLCLF